jgi:polysaccharide pyruvyl transferase WcaK-like protein
VSKISLNGFYAKNNFGDDLMQFTLSELLSNRGENQVQAYSDSANGNVINGYETQGHLKADLIVIGGGGIVNPKFWIFKKDGLNKLKQCSGKIIFLNVNVNAGDLSNANFTSGLKSLNAEWYVRDEYSISLLDKYGIKANFLPDITFYKYQERENIPGKTLAVALNSYVLNDYFSCDKDLRARLFVNVLSKFLDWMVHFGWHVKFVPLQTSYDFDDRIIGGAVYNSMKSKSHAIWISERLSHEQVAKELYSSNLIISMRYHSSVVAAAAGVPFIDIMHHNKNKAFINDIQSLGIAMDYTCVSHENFVKITQYAENNKQYKESISMYRQKALASWENFAKELTNVQFYSVASKNTSLQ